MQQSFIVRYGIIGGLISLVLGLLNWWLIARPMGMTVSQTVGYLTIAFSLLCIPLGIKYFRDSLNAHSVRLWEAMKIGLGITMVAAVVMALYGFLFMVFAGESFDQWQRAEMTATQLQNYEQQLAAAPGVVGTAWFQGVVMFVMVTIMGAIITLISALVLKRN